MSALKPQDLVVVAKSAVLVGAWTYAEVAPRLGMSVSEVHAAVQRARRVHLLNDALPGGAVRGFGVNVANFLEFAVHGLRFAFPAERGEIVRGFPTAHAAPALKRYFTATRIRPVWPDPEGPIQGEGFEPLYPSVPKAARKDADLYALLALLDLLRLSSARQREVAGNLLGHRLRTGRLP